MKAIVQDAYGSPDLLRLQQIEIPTFSDSEVLIRVRAASVHPDVWHVLTGLPYALRLMGAGLRRPKIRVPGTDLAGTVEAVGKNVTRFQPGDEVFGETISGFQWTNGGTYAEFAKAPQDCLALKPGNISFEEAAALPTSALIALSAFPDPGEITPGYHVLVNGAGGGVGSIAVQLAKAFTAEVTGVDTTSKLDMIRSIGADHVIDYTREDFTHQGSQYDLIVDIPGNHSLAKCRQALKSDGTYVLIGHDHFGEGMRRWVGLLPRMFKLMALSPFNGHLPPLRLSLPDRQESMELLQNLLESGKLRPYIDKTFSLSETPQAIHYLKQGHVKGKVVIKI